MLFEPLPLHPLLNLGLGTQQLRRASVRYIEEIVHIGEGGRVNSVKVRGEVVLNLQEARAGV
jgi:hypothetical protein